MDGFKIFHDRSDAGMRLAKQLNRYHGDPNTIVLALPRGGVPVAYEVAKTLHLPLDIFVVRKLGVPFHKELAMGAIASGDVIFLNDDLIAGLNITSTEINRVLTEEKIELQRREIKYRQGHPSPDIAKKNVILIDDGIATGASIRSAIDALKKLAPNKIIIATPVAPESIMSDLLLLADEVECIYPAPTFYGVGILYEDFSQTSDQEVISLLSDARKKNNQKR